jgi:cytochrome c oxidase cbb3-type subunit I/II
MPSYAHTEHAKIDFTHTADKLRAMRGVGVPYTNQDIEDAEGDALTQAHTTAAGLANEGILIDESSEMVALFAYLQRLGHAPNKPSSPAISER